MRSLWISRAARYTFALVAACAVAGAHAGDAFEKALPSNTFVFVKVDNVKNLKDSFLSSQMGQLWSDPAMQPMKDKLAAALEEANGQLKQAIGVTLDELLSLPEGPAGLALVSRDDPKIPLAALVAVDAGDNATKMAEVMASAGKRAEEAGSTVGTEESNGQTLHVIKTQEEDAPPVVWSQVESTFYFGSDLDAVKDLLGNLKGREDSLAANENFVQIAKKVDASAPVLWFADVNQLISLGIQIAGQNGVNGEEIAAQVQLTGVSGLKAIGGSFAFNQDEFDSVTKMFFYAPAPLQGVFKLFSSPPTDLKPEPWVPATVASYGSFSWEMDKFWGSLTELVDRFAPGQLEVAEQALAGPDGNGIDLKKDVFAALGKRITVISDYKKPITDASQRAVFAIALSDTTTAQNTINKVFTLAGVEPKKREFQSTTIYDVELPAEIAAAGLTGPMSIAIYKGHLMVSSEPTLLEQVLRGGSQSLADSAEFQEAIKHMPSNVSMLSFDRPEDQIQVMYAMFNNDQFKTALSQIQEQNPDGPKIEEFFDPKLMPDYKEVQKYFSPSGSYGVTSDEGFMITSFTLKNAK